MGLDMYAYTGRKGQMNEFYEQDIKFNSETGEWDVPEGGVQQPRELAYWRKHPNLHGWMEKLAQEKGLEYGTFNGVELELTYEDLKILERDVEHGRLPATQGFFFGRDADEHYKAQDLKFIQDARNELFAGNQVFYNSSW
jgi:hypothetical protein